jgi:NifB/MoaA-like Fe-S oxidoreductase
MGVHADALRSKVTQSAFSEEDFLSVVETLLTTQESFVQTVKGAVAARDLTNSDLLPNDPRYWDNLIAPSGGSQIREAKRFV